MTIAVPKGEAYTIENMTNIVLKDDIVPRAYGNEPFIRNFLSKLEIYLQDQKDVRVSRITGIINIPSILADGYTFVKSILDKVLECGRDVLQMYRHVGRIIYYESFQAQPIIYYNDEFNEIQETSGDITKANAEDYHMKTVKGPGFAWAN
mmetsp:Transcript_16062/g.23492  ORF Transcript_16062/g.23492 Transcript_16062/m.23492 type:complete len:150 (+) Transcript_16062:181-630(+)